MSESRLLVLRLGSLGDIVHTFPAVAGLRESFPNAEIIWLTHPRWELLVQSSGLASRIWPMDPRATPSLRTTIRGLRAAHWDAAIDYQGLWKSAGLAFFGGIKRRIGFSSQTIREFGVPILYTDRVRCVATHIADQNGELSSRAGARNGVAPFSLRIPEEDICATKQYLQKLGLDYASPPQRDKPAATLGSRYIVLSPGGGWRSKCWPAGRFGQLCRRIRDALGVRCVVNYGPGEEDLAKAVRDTSAGADPVLYNGALGLLMALLRNAACIVGGDTGPLHLAIALGTPAVAIHGPTDPARNGPYRTDDIVLRAPDAVRTHSRVDETHPSMLRIEVEQVFAALCRRLGIRQ
jgi:heptosyltransferase I